MGKHDKRINYVKILQRLRVESGQHKTDTTQLSDFQLLQEINAYLKHLGCIPFTVVELDEIASNLN